MAPPARSKGAKDPKDLQREVDRLEREIADTIRALKETQERGRGDAPRGEGQRGEGQRGEGQRPDAKPEPRRNPQPEAQPERFQELEFGAFVLQPMDGPEREANTAAAVAYCLAHPRWRLGLETHKLLGIP